VSGQGFADEPDLVLWEVDEEWHAAASPLPLNWIEVALCPWRRPCCRWDLARWSVWRRDPCPDARRRVVRRRQEGRVAPARRLLPARAVPRRV